MPTIKEAYAKQWARRQAKRDNCTHPGATLSHHGGSSGMLIAVYKCPSCKGIEVVYLESGEAARAEPDAVFKGAAPLA